MVLDHMPSINKSVGITGLLEDGMFISLIHLPGGVDVGPGVGIVRDSNN